MSLDPNPVGNDLTLAAAASGAQQGAQANLGNLTSFGPQPIVPQPVPQYHHPTDAFQIPQGNFQTTGERQRAEKQALFGGIAKVVKAGTDYVQQKKTRALQMDIERLMSAMDGLKEATASGDKEAMMKNAQIINDITTDPKKAKLIAKAFNIDLLGGGKNQTENKALFGAYQEYDKKQKSGQTPLNPNAQRIMASMPERQGINPQYTAQAQLIKDKVLPDANKQLEEQTKILEENGKNQRALLTAQTQADKQALTKKLTEDLIAAKDRQTKASIDNTNRRVLGEEKAAQIRANAGVQETAMRIKAQQSMLDDRMQNMKDLLQMNLESKETIATDKNKTQKEIAAEKIKNANQNKTIQQLSSRYRDLNQRSKTLMADNAKIQQMMKDQPSLFSAIVPWSKGTNLNSWEKGRKSLAEMQQRMQSNNMEIKAIEEETKKLDQTRQQMEKLQLMPPAPDNTPITVSPDEMPKDTGSSSDSGEGAMNITIDLSGDKNAGDSDQ